MPSVRYSYTKEIIFLHTATLHLTSSTHVLKVVSTPLHFWQTFFTHKALFTLQSHHFGQFQILLSGCLRRGQYSAVVGINE